MLSGPADLPFFNCLMALLISSFVRVQHLIGRSLVAGGIIGGFPGAGLLRSSSWRCSIHLFFCPSSSVSSAFVASVSESSTCLL
ncbi:hypothetical protein DPMN_121467 [Dreissena polymorpha]|uniref:Uncharacterized protein n=1 Tax=Dreissena polymorpha TaxID=45954 RepID=A0A9D4JR36_DREPO|nr:hypothetical protein DPMN_121467 [Dreissena polymorpha]